jgi:hypothetical protein
VRFELAIEDELARRGAKRRALPKAVKEHAEKALVAVEEEVKPHYLKTGDPVCVWDALANIDFASRILNRPIVLPNWILAYLVNAATEIMGRAVHDPAGNKGKPVVPTKSAASGKIFYSDHFSGLTPEQRAEAVLESLGLRKTGRKSSR